MNGIEILNETTKWTAGGGYLFLGIMAIIIALACLVAVIISIKERDFSYVSLAFLILTVLFSTSAFDKYANRKPYQEYKVTISDDVKFSEFTDKYEIISQEGKIYTVKLKDG